MSDQTKTPKAAGGAPAIITAVKIISEEMGLVRGVRTLLQVNQTGGVDCPGCAWPEPDRERSHFEFCENGAKHVADEATTKRVTPEFFEKWSVAELEQQSDQWLGAQGRLTHPMLLHRDATHYEPVSWDNAFELLAAELNSLNYPDQAVFYTSGRTSNEAAFLYQLFVRQFGTNNLPDCSNMCHESSGSALTEAIGVGKGSVSLEDLEAADLIIVMGQNPGTNHPRMLSTLEEAKQNGAVIVALNPLPEAGLINFKNPQKPKRVVGSGTPIADDYLQVRLGGDLALLLAVGKLLIEAEDQNPGTVVDRAFVEQYTAGFPEYVEHVRKLDLSDLIAGTGLTEADVRSLVE